MSNFEWYTDEDGNWAELSPAPLRPQPEHKRWFLWLIILMVVSLAVFVGYRRLNQQVEEVSSYVTGEILSSYQLRERAIANQDSELFDSVLSGSNLQWMQAQQRLFAENLTVDRWPLGLHAATAVPDLLTIPPTANLQTAELTIAQEYVTQRPDGVQESVILHRTDVYRLGRLRWLYAPPTPEFWGEWLTADGRYLSLIYPQRDQAIAQQLMADSDAHLAAYCAWPDSQCPADFQLLVRFGTHPQNLLDLSHLPDLWQKSPIFELPTPSLIGLPIDDMGYQAISRGYSQQIIAAAIRENSGWPCCEQGLFHQALIDKQLSQLSLKTWPLTDKVYATVFQSPIAGIDQLHRFWPEPPTLPLAGNVWPQIYGAVDFVLFREPDASVPAMQRTLLAANSYTDWLYDYTLPRISNDYFQQEWLRFAASQLAERTAVTPPNQDILLLCRSSSQRTNQTTLFRYAPHTDTITPDLSHRNFLFMTPLPQDEGVLLHERQVIKNRTQVILWQNGQEVPAYVQPLSVGLFHVEPLEDTLTLYGYDFNNNQSLLDVLPMSTCKANNCPTHRLMGTPYWSPNGRYALLITDTDQLHLADAQGNILQGIGTGTAPFWLDDSHYGYAHVAGNLNRTPAELVVTAVHDNQPQTWLPLAKLANALPAPLRLSHLTIRAIATAPGNSDLLFIAAHVRTRQSELRTLLFTYWQQTGAIEMIYASPYTLGFYKPLTFSPDGNWLTTTAFAHTSTLSDLFIYHIPTGQIQILGSNHLFSALEYDWSADSQWLLRLENGFLHLIKPGTDQQKIFIHGLSGCSYAAWVK